MSGKREVQALRILALLALPRDYRYIAEVAGLSGNAASSTLWRLERAGRAFVLRWDTAHRGRHTPVFMAGPYKSAPKPAAMTRAQRSQLERQRLYACPLKHELLLAKRKAERQAGKSGSSTVCPASS